MKKLRKVLVGISIAAMLMGCGSASSDKATMAYESEQYADNGVYESAAAAEEEVYEDAQEYDSAQGSDLDSAEKVDESAQASSRKLIKTVTMDVQTEGFDALKGAVEKQVNALGGYIENSNMYESGYSSSGACRRLDLTIRIPREKLDSFVGQIEQGSNVKSKQESVDDVTLTYVDLKSRKEAYEARKKRLMKFMDEATSMEELLSIDKQLTEVLYQIESMEAQLRTYDNQIDYSTVYLNIEEVKRIEPAAEEGMWGQISSGFVGSLEDVLHGIRSFIIWFLSNLPHIVIWVLIIGGIVTVFCKISRKRKAKKQAKTEAAQKRKEQEKRELNQDTANSEEKDEAQNETSDQEKK